MSNSFIIGGVRYTLEKRNLLCVATERRESLFVDPFAKEHRLHYPRGKAFILDTVDCVGHHAPKQITKEEAFEFMDTHPAGIIQKNYCKFFEVIDVVEGG